MAQTNHQMNDALREQLRRKDRLVAAATVIAFTLGALAGAVGAENTAWKDGFTAGQNQAWQAGLAGGGDR